MFPTFFLFFFLLPFQTISFYFQFFFGIYMRYIRTSLWLSDCRKWWCGGNDVLYVRFPKAMLFNVCLGLQSTFFSFSLFFHHFDAILLLNLYIKHIFFFKPTQSLETLIFSPLLLIFGDTSNEIPFYVERERKKERDTSTISNSMCNVAALNENPVKLHAMP